jgi:cyclase
MASTRAQFLTGVAAVGAAAAASSHSAEAIVPSVFKSARVQSLAPGVFALEGVVGHAWCNLAWVEFSDYVAVLDAGSHSLAEAVLSMIRTTTDKAIRFVLNTHHHGDHCYGNEVWMHRGAAVMAYTGMPAELARVEPGRLRAYPTLTSSKTRPNSLRRM